MITNRLCLSMFVLGFVFQTSTAQINTPDSTKLNNESFDIVKPFEPVLADALKIEFSPDVAVATTNGNGIIKNPVFNDYVVPNRLLKLFYKPPQLKPLAYQNDKSKKDGKNSDKFEHVWIKAGFGNITLPLVDVAVNTSPTNKGYYGLNANFMHAKGDLKYQQNDNIAVMGYGKRILKLSELNFDVGYKNSKHFNYGYNHFNSNLDYTSDSLKIVRQSIGANLNLGTGNENELNASYFAALGFEHFFDNRDGKEEEIKADLNLNKSFNENWRIGLNNQLHTALFKNKNEKHNDLALNSLPYISYFAHWGKILLGLNAGLNNTEFVPYPNLSLEIWAIPEKLSILAGINKVIHTNNYQSLSNNNPFITNELEYKNTKKETRLIGVRGVLSNKATLEIKGYQQISQEQPLYVNNKSDIKTMEVLYEPKLSSLNTSIEMVLTLTSKLSGSINAGLHKYKLEKQKEAWHLPTLDATLIVSYMPVAKLQLGTEWYLAGGVKAQASDDSVIKLKTGLEANLMAKYTINKNISLFCNLNNLTNTKYQTFLQYPVYGFQALAGFILKF